MKAIILLASFFILATTAFAQVASAPFCYSGTLKLSNEATARPVFLQFNGVQGKYYMVEKFNLGNDSVGVSGKLVGTNTLQFNHNDDYIPGGNASFNLDIELVFNGKNATGAYKLYEYADGQGRGGFGQAGAEASVTGEFKLRLCKTEIIQL